MEPTRGGGVKEEGGKGSEEGGQDEELIFEKVSGLAVVLIFGYAREVVSIDC